MVHVRYPYDDGKLDRVIVLFKFEEHLHSSDDLDPVLRRGAPNGSDRGLRGLYTLLKTARE